MKYFIAYSWHRSHASGVGNIDIDCAAPIDSIDRVREVEAAIGKTHPVCTSIVIQSFQAFDDRAPAQGAADQEGGAA